MTTVSTQAVVIEPALYWPGPQRPIHAEILTDDQRASLPVHEGDAEADAFIARYREALLELFASYGSAHLQVGRSRTTWIPTT